MYIIKLKLIDHWNRQTYATKCTTFLVRKTTDRQTDRRTVTHVHPPCKLQRWAQKYGGLTKIAQNNYRNRHSSVLMGRKIGLRQTDVTNPLPNTANGPISVHWSDCRCVLYNAAMHVSLIMPSDHVGLPWLGHPDQTQRSNTSSQGFKALDNSLIIPYGAPL